MKIFPIFVALGKEDNEDIKRDICRQQHQP